MALDDDLRGLAELQYSVIARRQARAIGASAAALRHRARGPDWEPVTPAVLRLRGSRHSDEQRAMSAVLDAGHGAVLSHNAAAAWWGLPGFDLEALHVTRSRGRSGHTSRLAQLHEVRVLPSHHVTVLRSVPVTTPARTLFDLAGTLHPKRVERAIENAWSDRIVDGRVLSSMLDDMAGRGRRGVSVMRSILAERGPDYVPPASGLEGRFRDLLRRAGLPPMVRQIDVGGETWLGRVDFLNREAKLVVQIDSERHHTALIDRRADDAQTAAMEDAGFLVLRFTDAEVWYHGDKVVAELRRARTGHRKPRSSA
jgi:very-short-patch-repair endonuclease